jgi:hypothetical protein
MKPLIMAFSSLFIIPAGRADPCYDACASQFTEYARYLNGLSEITDATQSVDVQTIESELKSKLNAWEECETAEKETAGLVAAGKAKKDCDADASKQWVNDACVVKTVAARGHASAPVVPTAQTHNDPESNLCAQSGGEWNDRAKNCDCDPKNDGLNYYDEDAKDCKKLIDDAQQPDELYCPTDNPRMKSLNAKDKIGDPCSYGNVTIGKIFKYKTGAKRDGKDVSGTCSCTAAACMAGYHVSGGNCVEDVANAAEEAQSANIDYFEVCGKDKGKSGGKEYCVQGVFETGWSKTGNGYDLNTSVMQGVAFAEEYIAWTYKIDAVCDNAYRESGNDDFLKCTSRDNKTFFEVRFDDLAESMDSQREKEQKYAICHVYGMEKTADGCKASNASECDKLKKLSGRLAYDIEFARKDIIVQSGGGSNAIGGASLSTIPTTACWIISRGASYQATEKKSVEDMIYPNPLDRKDHIDTTYPYFTKDGQVYVYEFGYRSAKNRFLITAGKHGGEIEGVHVVDELLTQIFAKKYKNCFFAVIPNMNPNNIELATDAFKDN